ncbi:MAG: hypothetical protein ACR2IF_13705 [Terriglobales bacterium]
MSEPAVATNAAEEVRRWSKEIERIRAELRDAENRLETATRNFQLASARYGALVK